MRKFRVILPVLGLCALAVPATAQASEKTRVATSFEEDNPFDLHFGVAYAFDYKRAAILREWGNGGENRLAKDLVYRQYRQTVTAGVEIGVFRDVSVYAELPIVVADSRNYAFDQEAGDCVFPEDLNAGTGERQATCVNKTNSSSIRDAIIPADGFDAQTPNAAYTQFTDPATELIFKGPVRRGLDQLHVGVKAKILNQDKLSHMPNWVVGLEGRFAVGRPMNFTRDIATDAPASNSSVGRGIHELGAWTALSRRYRYLEPFFGAWWRQSLRAANTEFKNFPNTDKPNPMSQAGFYFGTEIVPWEDKAKKQKVSLILNGGAEFRYNGREYSEVWELLADSPALVGTPRPADELCNELSAVDYARANPSDPSGYLQAANDANNSGGCQKFNGITTVQDYAVFNLNAAFAFHLGQYARLTIGADMKTATRHFLTSANRGDPDRAGDPDIVDADTADVNPARRDTVDNVGRRYAIDDVFNIVAYAQFLLTF